MAPASHGVDERSFSYFGWCIVLVSIVGLSCSTGTTLIYTFGVFAKPLARELQASRGSLALAMSLIDLMTALTAPRAGRMVDRYGARGMIVGSLVALSVCLVELSCLQPPLWHLYAIYGLAGLTTAATTSVSYSRVVAHWFDRERGLALGLASSGAGVGAFVTPLGAQFLIDHANWRVAYLGLAATCLMVAAPVVWLFLRSSPPEVGPPSHREQRRESLGGLTAREALRTGTFWQLTFIFFCVAANVGGASAHLVPLLTDAGVSARSAALAASVFGAAMIVGRIGNGYLVDRFAGSSVAASLFAGATCGVALLWSGLAVKTAFLSAMLLGLAAGAEADLMPFLISRYFGLRSMGELYGYIFGVFTMGNAVGRYLLAAGFDAWGSYKAPLAWGTVALILSMGGALLLGDYRKAGPKCKAAEERG